MKSEKNSALFRRAALLLPVYLLLLALPTVVARWCDARLVSTTIPRPIMEGQLSGQAQEIPVVYGLYRKRILSHNELPSNAPETDPEAQAHSLSEVLWELEQAGVMTPACRKNAEEILTLPSAVAYTTESDGFVQMSYLGYTPTGSSRNILVQQQADTGLVTSCCLDAEGTADTAALLEAYRRYLGLERLTDWQTAQTETGGTACWSREGQLYVYCSFREGRFAIGAVSMAEKELQAVADRLG